MDVTKLIVGQMKTTLATEVDASLWKLSLTYILS